MFPRAADLKSESFAITFFQFEPVLPLPLSFLVIQGLVPKDPKIIRGLAFVVLKGLVG